MKILVLNAGSSSIKFRLFEMTQKAVLAEGIVEKIGEKNSVISHRSNDKKSTFESEMPDHHSGLNTIADLLLDPKTGAIKSADDILAVGHRVVHGGEKFSQPTLVDQAMLKELNRLTHLAPLHNPANILGIEVASQVFQQAKQVAVFDTAFHQTMPEKSFLYAIPKSLYEEKGIRAYGFHGTSHQYVSKTAASFLNISLNTFNAISIHLGNGCSITAIKEGQSLDTSMGLTPMGGLVMGTRSGDIDPSIIIHLCRTANMELDEIDRILNKESGLKGLTGDNDLRSIVARYEQKDSKALLAIDIYVNRIKKYIGAYAAILGSIDAIIFTAGVGENSALIRQKVCQGLGIFGVKIDAKRNAEHRTGIKEIQSTDSNVKIMIVPTNEELEIANQTMELLTGKGEVL